MDHLLLSQRKAFVLRWHVAAAEPAGALREDDGWASAERAIAGACKSARCEDDGEPLDRFVDLALDHRDIGVPLACGCAAALAALHGRRGHVRCGDCAGRAGAVPCAEDWPRSDALAASGDCLAPVHAAVRAALDLAAGLYGRTCGVAPALVRVRTGQGGIRPFAGVQQTVDGNTAWPAPPPEGGAAGETVLRVTIDVGRFDRSGLKLLAYMAAHEAVCHVYQQVADPGRRNPRLYDAFAEGWMDFVAAELVAGTRGEGWSGEPGPGPFGDAEAAEMALSLHDKRRDRLVQAPYVERAKVAQGRAAALAVLRLFRADDAVPPADCGGAWDDFVALSCQLNVMAWGPEARAAAMADLPGRLREETALADRLLAWRRQWWAEAGRGDPALTAPVIAALTAAG